MPGKLDQLEDQGFIQRIPDADDRRAIRLGTTDSGRALIDEAFTTSLAVYQSMLTEFSVTEAKELDTLLDKLVAHLDELSGLSRPWSVGPGGR